MFSEECARALHAAVSSACREALEIAPQSELWEHVLRLVYPTIQSHAREQTSAVSPAYRLPDELLVEVFSYLPVQGRLRAATVCHRWRSVSLHAASQLWSTIVSPGSARACSTFLDLANGAPVTLTIHALRQGNIGEISRLIAKHLHHIRALDLTLPLDPNLPMLSGTAQAVFENELFARISTDASALSGAFKGDALILERLRIANYLGLDIRGLVIPLSPLLYSIDLRGVNLSCLRECMGSPVLRSLVISAPETRSGFLRKHWPQLCSFTRLGTLAVKVSSRGSAVAGSTSAQGRSFPATLKHVYLSLCMDTLSQATDPADFARLDSWYLSFVDFGPQFATLVEVQPYLQTIVSPASAAVQFAGSTLHLMLSNVTGRRGTVRAIRFDPSWSFLIAGVTTLCIGGLVNLPNSVVNARAAFPALEDLTLDITPDPGVVGSPSSRFQWPRLGCSCLRIVRFMSARARSTLSLDAVRGVLLHSLDRGARTAKLEMLALGGVDIEVPPNVDLTGSLLELANEVDVQDSPGVWKECQLLWNKSWEQAVA